MHRACREVLGFEALLARFECNISVLGRSPRTFDNYSRHVAARALHFQCLPTELDAEQVQDYLYLLQQRSKTPSQTYFKHTVYGLRFLLKAEGLPYDYLRLPSIARSTKLPVILSRDEVWAMLQTAKLLKHKLLIIRHYGILSSIWKRGRLQALQASLKVYRPIAEASTKLGRCPCCKTGKLVTIEVFGQRGPPVKYLPATQTAPGA